MASVLRDLLMTGQRDWVLDPSPLKIAEKGRQLGWTWIEAFWSVMRRLEVAIDHWFISADETQAKQFIQDCKDWCEKFNLIASIELGDELIPLDNSAVTVSRLTFPHPTEPGKRGPSIYALSSNPKAVRGKRGDITLDEFAFHEEPIEMMKAAQAVKRWGDGQQPGHLHIISTHNGPASLYRDILEAAKKGENDFSVHRMTLDDALAQGLANKVPGDHRDKFPPGPERNAAFRRAVRRECPTEEIFRQEHLCEPLAATALITPEMYDAVKCDGPVPTQLDPSKTYNELFVGVDVARSQNLTVIVALEVGYWPKEIRPELDEEDRYVYRPACVRAMHNVPIDEQFLALDRILSHPQVSKCVIDMGAIGRALSDMAVRKYGEGMIEALGISRPVKEDLCEKLAGMVQRKRMGLPDDPRCREDVLSMRRECSDKGVLTYNGKTSFSHCDYFLGFAIANRATGSSVSVRLVGDTAVQAMLEASKAKEEREKSEAA